MFFLTSSVDSAFDVYDCLRDPCLYWENCGYAVIGAGLGFGLGKVAILAGKALGKTATLWRAVKPQELLDIKLNGIFRNLGSAEGKYFSSTAEGAASYARQAVKSFGDPPYTIVKTEVPSKLLNKLDHVLVDREVPGVFVPDNSLQGLTPVILNHSPLP